jgi:addiction module HigA family antidote
MLYWWITRITTEDKKMTEMFNPPHPGIALKEDVLPALGLSVTQAADQLGVSRNTLSRVLNAHAAISPEMALRLEKWLGNDRGGNARLWLAQQSAYDLWQAGMDVKKNPLRVHRAPQLSH